MVEEKESLWACAVALALWSAFQVLAPCDFYRNDFDNDFLAIDAEGQYRMSASLQLQALQCAGLRPGVLEIEGALCIKAVLISRGC